MRINEMMKDFQIFPCDVLVIGTGAAGCAAAITAAEKTAQVILVNKGTFGRSGTTCLGSVVYAAGLGHTDERDTPDFHFLDTIVEGRYLGNQELVKILAEEAPRTVYDLERYGVSWYKRGEKVIDPSRYDYFQLPSPPHRYNRGVHQNEKTGQAIQKALCKEVRKHSRSIRIADDIYIWKGVVNDGRVQGALGLDLRTGQIAAFPCKALVIATGGAGSSYKVTDMDTGATGDGYALALDAGADLIDMEFTQFFPTSFVHPESLQGIIVATSALWTSGLKLYNKENERFMARQFPSTGENLPRDILSRHIFMEIEAGRGTPHGGVWLDTSAIENWEGVRKDRPRSYLWPERFGVAARRFEIAPTYHFTLGGIRINGKCETNIAGLYAAGEAAGGVHGANRLAGNALAECTVFGQIAGKEAAGWRREEMGGVDDSAIGQEVEKRSTLFEPGSGRGHIRSATLVRKLREIMYRDVGVVRDRNGLTRAQKEIAKLREAAENDLEVIPGKIFNYDQIQAFELFNMLDLCQLVIQGASRREESRGAHYRRDYPATQDPKWLKNNVYRRREDALQIETVDVETPYVQIPESSGHE